MAYAHAPKQPKRITPRAPVIPAGTPARVHDVLRSPGKPLDSSLRSAMQSRFDQNFDSVQVHADDNAGQAANALDARAFTQGSHIVFAPGEYAPTTPSGQRLIAHELAHVVQQTSEDALDQPESRLSQPGDAAEYEAESAADRVLAGERVTISQTPSALQRQSQLDTLVQDFNNGIILQQWPAFGQALLTYRGERWVVYQWTAHQGRRLTVSIPPSSSGPNIITVNVSADFNVTARVNLDIENYISDWQGVGITIDHNYKFNGAVYEYTLGRVSSRSKAPYFSSNQYLPRPLPPTTRTDSTRKHRPGRFPIDRLCPSDSLIPSGHFAPGMPSTSLRHSHTDTNWAGILLPRGDYIAFALTRDALYRMAQRMRAQRRDFDFLHDFEGGTLVSLVINGEVQSLEMLRDQYFATLDEVKPTPEVPEFEVYQMQGGMYERKRLTHQQALVLWQQFDTLTNDQIFTRELEPGSYFAALQVRGRTQTHHLSRHHFEGRETFFRTIKDTLTLHNVSLSTREADFVWTNWNRPVADPQFEAALKQNPAVATSVQTTLYKQVEDKAQEIAINSISNTQNYVRQIASSRDSARQFVLNSHLRRLNSRNRHCRSSAFAVLYITPYPSLPEATPRTCKSMPSSLN